MEGALSHPLLMRSLRAAMLLFVVSTCIAAAEDLVDDYSRGDLLRYSMSIGPNPRAFPDGFNFPTDAKARPELLFGVDVSHYDGLINWSSAREQEIRFAYVKATQGVLSTDNTFARNWADIRKLSDNESRRVYRGAYHFLSAQGDAKAQAQHFLSVLGAAQSTDLPPCVDVEWDAPPGSTDLDAADRWTGLSASEIVAKIQTWLDVVEKSTGKAPVIYTQPGWWQNRVGTTDKLAKYQIWIADYTTKSQLSEVPRKVPGYVTNIWQFSEHGRAKTGFPTKIDVTIFRGSQQEFLTAFALPK
jgi:lysozyme